MTATTQIIIQIAQTTLSVLFLAAVCIAAQWLLGEIVREED